MILQALNEYFYRKKEDGTLPPHGFIQKRIDFLIVLDETGRFCSLDCHQQKEGNRLLGQKLFVPAIGKQAEKHDNSGKDANLLWDKAEFVLGVGKNGEAKLGAFIRMIEDYFPSPPYDIQCILNFLKRGRNDRSLFSPITDHPEYGELIGTGRPNLSFRIEGRSRAVVCEPFIETAFEQHTDDEKVYGICLITGNKNSLIELTHFVVKGITGREAKPQGANLVSFNKDAFLSHGWKQAQNAPVSKEAATAYVKALTYLCNSERNKIKIADTTTVFWSQKQVSTNLYDFEQNFSSFFADPPKDDPDRGVLAVKALYQAIYSGSIPTDEGNWFYVLGLAPNAARISVRFWKTGTIKQFADKIKKHFDDMEIVRSPKDPEYLTLNQILRATALDYKMDNVPPNLAGVVLESILEGTPYPVTLLHQCIRRVRAKREVTRDRAAILKAYINRVDFNKPYRKEEITVSLDRTNTMPSYRLGRLFAVLEKIQEEAMEINTTIRDRFYGAASSSPVTVFPQLLKLKNHHLSKLTNPGRRVNFEKELCQIFDALQEFPAHLSMEDQARFAIGYYHERQFFFSSKNDESTKTNL